MSNNSSQLENFSLIKKNLHPRFFSVESNIESNIFDSQSTTADIAFDLANEDSQLSDAAK